ncbi:MAG: outer membrane porin, OprD family [Campylobacterales bacterium]|nr:outer membrane porin, OprD family [Campylobacterales bacterium]
MKKRVAVGAGLLIAVSGLQGAEDLSTMFSEGKTSGQIRMFSVSRSVSDSRPGKDEYTRKANALGGYLKYETAQLHGLSLGAAFYTTNGFLLESPKTDYIKVDPTLLGPDNENYTFLGEAYLQYTRSKTRFKGGRQKLDTPMAGSDDARMLPNLFEAYMLSNTDIPDTTLLAGHITRFAQGTFGRVYNAGILSATSGYSAVDSRDHAGSFVNMGGYAVGEETRGVSVASVTYAGVEGLKLQLWDYYAHDILNALYGQADYTMKAGNYAPFLAAQFIKEDDVGSKALKNLGGDGKIDSFYWGLKAGVNVGNFSAHLAYSHASANKSGDEPYANAIITPWGGMSAFTQGMVTRHMFLAGTKASKAAFSYNWKDFGPDLETGFYYTDFDMDAFNGYTLDDASESGFDLIYNSRVVKNLQLRFRGNFTSDYLVTDTGALDWDEYRLIANYSF